MTKQPAVYILASQRKGALYTGVTSDLVKRIWEHRSDLVDGFTKRYGIHCLVYFELHSDMYEAIRREKQIKKWNRAWKIDLIDKANSQWHDLWPTIVGGVDLDSRSPLSRGQVSRERRRRGCRMNLKARHLWSRPSSSRASSPLVGEGIYLRSNDSRANHGS